MCSDGSETAAVDSAEERTASVERLAREICELGAHIEAATCRWLLLLGEFEEREGWGLLGYKTCAQWLSWECSLSPTTARERVRVARALRGLPLAREAFARGELSYCKVRALTRVAVPEIEADLVEIARHATGAQLEKLVRGYGRALTATVGTAQQAHEQRHLSFSWEDDGSLRVEGRLTADEGALVMAAVAAYERPPGDEYCERAGVRRADALVNLARGALDAPARERAGGDRCELVVHVDVDTLVSDDVRERAEVENGPALAAETVRRLGCDAAVVGMLERGGVPVSSGRRTRTIPPALRRALRSRDRGCRFPGCDHQRFFHAHHIHHWARGGPTTMENLVQLCSFHHRLVHEGGFQVERIGRQGVRFRRPDGCIIPDQPRHSGLNGPALEVQNRRLSICPDADTVRPLSVGDRLDYGIAVESLLARALAAT
jgi:hypothetical protein